LAARLDRLAPVKEIAQIGAAIGREFSYPLLCAVAGRDEPALRAALAQLTDRERVGGGRKVRPVPLPAPNVRRMMWNSKFDGIERLVSECGIIEPISGS
jgi:hypothetical protein